MTYPRYIKRKGKIYGPYYYKSVRDEKGDVLSVYVGRKPESSPASDRQSGRLPKPSLVMAFAFACILVLIAFGISYTSFFVLKENAYTQALNIAAAENMSYQWSPENPGNLTSFRISGSFTGNGTARVYLKTKDKSYLVFDSFNSEFANFTVGESPVTGFQILEEENNVSPPKQNQTINATGSLSENLAEEAAQEEQNFTQAQETNATTENASSGTITGNATIENLTIPENASYAENVTDIGEHAAEPEITNETSDGTENAEPLQTAYKFDVSCIETCSIELSDKEYTLWIEVDNGTVLTIEDAIYTIIQKENNPPALFKEIPDMKIYPGNSKQINLLEYFSDPDGDELEFSFIAEDPLTVFMDSGIATISTDPNFEGNAKLTFIASDLVEKTPGNEITVLIRRFNRLPEGNVPEQSMETDSSLKLDLSGFFSDPDGDSLSYSVVPNGYLGLGLKGDKLSIAAGSQEGLFTVILNVSDGKGFALSDFHLKVSAGENLEKEAKGLEERLGVKVSRLEKAGGKYQLELSKGNSLVRISGLDNITGVNDIRAVDTGIALVGGKSVRLGTHVLAADIPGIESAEITLEKTGTVNAILECRAYDLATDSCPEWVPTQIPFADNGTHIIFTVEHFSGYAGAYIIILNLQSYPTVGDNWTVAFNTTGTAPLYITASNGTTWSDSQDTEDLRLLEIRCGQQTLSYEWIPENSTAFIQDFSCPETAYETSHALTGGTHTLQFTFGEDTEYAHNFATFNCSTCASCSAYLQNGSMSDGDVLQLTTDFANQNLSGGCISFGGKDGVAFDCLGNTIDGDDIGSGEYGILLDQTGDGSNNNTVRNCIVTDFLQGIRLYTSSNNILTNITSSSSSTGIYIYTSSNNTLTNITANNNTNDGLYLDTLSNSKLQNIIANNYQYGLYLYSNSNNTLTNITASSNNVAGLYLYSSSNNNTLTNITANSNTYHGLRLYTSSNNTITSLNASHNLQNGIYLSDLSEYNTINNSRIENNTLRGINLTSVGSNYPRYNSFYNNFLNNTVNLGSSNASNLNYWNTTKTPGTNIMGGSYIGGNCWTDPDGNFSDTCTDSNSDGICESPSSYTPADNNTDYLPLLSVTTPPHWPEWFQNSTNGTTAGAAILHSVNWTDNESLSGYIFAFYNGSNWTDGNCGDYSASQGQCAGFGCTWTPYSCSGSGSACSGRGTQSDCQNCGCTWTPVTATNHVYNFSNMTGLTVYAKTDGSAQPPTWANALTTVAIGNVSAGCYTNLTSDDGNFCQNASIAGNSYPFLRFNFTIDENVANINFIYVTADYSSGGGSTTTETTKGDALRFSDTTLQEWFAASLTEVTNSYNLSANIANYLNSQNQLVIVFSGYRQDATEWIGVDYINVTVNYNAPAYCGGTTTCSSQGASYCSECGCSETSSACSGTPNYEMKNDSWVSFTGTQNWSNVTKSVNTTIGAAIKWCVYANDTSGQWNGTSCQDPFTYITTGATYTCATCGTCSDYLQASNTTLQPGDTLRLSAKLTSGAASCINSTGKQNFTLDCDGFQIQGSNSGTAYIGINLSSNTSGYNNTIIKNCANISYFTYGIYVRYSENVTIHNSSLFLNTPGTAYGIYLQNSQRCNLTDINSSQNAYGLSLSSSSNNTLTNITANSNTQYGLYLTSSSNNTLTNVTANSNSWYGLYLTSSSNNTLTNITANFNTNTGLYLFSSSNYNTLTNITANSNTQIGISLSSSNYNNISNVNASGPSQLAGLYLQSSSNNTLTNITANSNTQYGLYLTSSSNNTLRNASMQNNTYNFYVSSSSFTNYIHDIDTSNTVEWGRPIYYWVNKTEGEINSTSNAGVIYLINCTNVTVRDVNVSYMNYHGILLYLTNSTITNATSNSNYNGLYLTSSSNNTLTNITASSNTQYGLYLQSSSNYNNVTSITANNNSQYGLYLQSSSNNRLTNITANSNPQYGINFYYSYNNTFTNIATYANQYGLYLYYSSNNTLINVTASSNSQYGILIRYDSDYNNVTGSTLVNNTQAGIYLDEGGSADPEYNRMWNNYLNNTLNIMIESVITNRNYFNASLNCSAGPNIIGGPCIGGNYYTDPDGQNFSDGCADSDGDGICNNDYTLGPNTYDIDYEPLAENPPQLVYVSPTLANSSYTQNQSWIYVNVSANESLSSCLLDWHSDTWTNVSMELSGFYCYVNMTGLTNGTSYYFRVYGNDSAGNLNVTEDRSITVNLTSEGGGADTTPPDLWFTLPASNGTSTGYNWIFVNVSASEGLNACMLDWHSDSWQNVSMTAAGFYCYVNMTDLTSGSYYFRVYGNDSAGNLNVTEDREATADLTAPYYQYDQDNSSGSVVEGETVKASTYWNDALSGLGAAILRTNGTGSWANEGYHAFSGKPEYSNFTIDTAGQASETICWVMWANDSHANMNSSMASHCFDVTPVISILTIESINIQPDDGDPGTVINPVESSNKTVNVTVTVTNSTGIDACEVRIFNSSMSYSNPVFLYTGTIQNCGATCDCFRQWDMEYWSNDGDWNVSVYINLTTGVGNFTSQNFTYNTLISISVNASTITFTGIPQQTVNSTNAYPLEIKNTGNQMVSISMKGTDFTGVSWPSYVVGVGNSTYNETADGIYQQLTGSFVQIFVDLAPAEAKNLFFRAYLPPGFIQQDYQNTIEIAT